MMWLDIALGYVIGELAIGGLAVACVDAAYWLDKKRPEDMSRHEVQDEIDRLRYEIGEVER